MIAEPAKIPHIRETIVDGIFYPQEKEKLLKSINDLLGGTKEPKDTALGIITPHAGLQYAGNLMAEAFNAAAARQIKTVVLLAPEHRDMTEEAVLPESSYFQTPLGSIEVNQNYIEELLSCSTGIVRNDIPHLEEHCIEIQLPFIQTLFPGASIVPILVGTPKRSLVKLLANALQLTFKAVMDSTLFVATSNLTSTQKNPEGDCLEVFCNLLEQGLWEDILDSSRYKIRSCGGVCIAVLLNFQSALRIKILDTGDSRKINPNSQNIVYYASLALFSEQKKIQDKNGF